MSSETANGLLKRHPLQRLNSPGRGLSAFLHIAGLAVFAYDFKCLFELDNPMINNSYGWHFQFLTIIGLSTAVATFAVGLLADITLSRHLFLLKNTLSIVSGPLEVLISILYWGLRTIDPKLVQPDWAPPIDPKLDLGLHAIPATVLVIDLFIFSPPYTIAALPALGLSTTLAFGYWFWIEQCYSRNGFYPYPIFEMLDASQRVMLFAGSGLICTASLWLLQWTYRVANGKNLGSATPTARPGNLKKSS